MSNPIVSTALLLVLAAPAPSAGARDLEGVQIAQLTIRQRIIIRIPTLSEPKSAKRPASPVPLPPANYAEKKGPKCVVPTALVGASVTRDDSVDFVLADGRRMRAKLGDDCPALDFYKGFYVKQSGDGMVCAGRDSVRSRSGDQCPIDAFKMLVPKK